MKRLLPLLLILAVVGPPLLALERHGQTEFTQGYWGQKVMWIWAWDTLKAGSVVVWKADSVVARAAQLCTVSVAKKMTDSLYWGPYHRLRIDSKDPAGYSAACSCIVAGLDTAGAVQTETLTFAATTASDTLKFSTKTWSKVRTATWLGTGAADSFLVYGYPIKCVTTTTSNENIAVAGVVMDTTCAKVVYSGSGVDSYARMVTDGVVPTLLVAEARRPGQYLATSTTAMYGTIATSPAEGSVFGRVLYAGTAIGKYPVLVHTQ